LLVSRTCPGQVRDTRAQHTRRDYLAICRGAGVNECMSLKTRLRIHSGGERNVGTWVRPALLFGATAVVLAACGPGSREPAPSSPPATSATSSAPSSASPTAGAPTALDAYRGMWKAYVDAIHIPDPNYPDLARYAQGDALAVFVKGLTSVQRDGLVGQGDVT